MQQKTWISTIKYLEIRQIFYFIYYRININKLYSIFYFPRKNVQNSTMVNNFLVLRPGHFRISDEKMYLLNKEMAETPVWNDRSNGDLWNYNLHYFDYIFHPDYPSELAHKLIESYETSGHSLAPYPISVRGINWIKYFIVNDYYPQKSISQLRQQYQVLFHSIEYQHNANHLLENALSLYIGGIFFSENKFIRRSSKILRKELHRQFFNDGAHFELSTMYHRIILAHLLDALAISTNNKSPETQDIVELFTFRIKKMVQWLSNLEIDEDIFPEFGDSSNYYGPSFRQIKTYCDKLGVDIPRPPALSDSGNRIIKEKKYTFSYKTSPVSPDCNPGHSHCDMFSFELYCGRQPVIVDTGVSTYENNEHRNFERSTAAHNTVRYGKKEQNQMWGAFRVGKRAKEIKMQEKGSNLNQAYNNSIIVENDHHQRSVICTEKEIQIYDKLLDNPSESGYFFLHFAPNIKIRLKENIIKTDFCIIQFIDDNNPLSFKQEDYLKAVDFNLREKAQMVIVKFKSDLQTRISIK